MAKQSPIRAEGIVAELLPNSRYKVVLVGSRDKVVLARRSGALMKKRNLYIGEGSRVALELPPADLSQGRITRKLAD